MFKTDQKCAVDAMQSMLQQTPFGRVEKYFSFRRKAGEDDKTSPVKYSLYCPELEEDDADPLCALRDLILSGEERTLPGLRYITFFIYLSFSLTHLMPPAVLHSATHVCWVRARCMRRPARSCKLVSQLDAVTHVAYHRSYFKTSLPVVELSDPIEAFLYDGVIYLTSVE